MVPKPYWKLLSNNDENIDKFKAQHIRLSYEQTSVIQHPVFCLFWDGLQMEIRITQSSKDFMSVT